MKNRNWSDATSKEILVINISVSVVIKAFL